MRPLILVASFCCPVTAIPGRSDVYGVTENPASAAAIASSSSTATAEDVMGARDRGPGFLPEGRGLLRFYLAQRDLLRRGGEDVVVDFPQKLRYQYESTPWLSGLLPQRGLSSHAYLLATFARRN